MNTVDARRVLDQASAELQARITTHLDSGGRLVVVKAPPGSGKTYTLMHVVAHLVSRGLRVALGTQTNAQANDVCRELVDEFPGLSVRRFGASGTSAPTGFPTQVPWLTASSDLPTAPAVVVGPVAKWAMSKVPLPFDVMAIDEAWQMAWADFMPCQQVASRFVMIGDPGQIPPVVPIPVQRWETSPRPPHRPAPEVILDDPALRQVAFVGGLPACRRLPYESIDLVRPFYDFDFEAYAPPRSRFVRPSWRGHGDGFDRAVELMETGQPLALTIPTGPEGPPLEEDEDLAAAAAALAQRLLDARAVVSASDDGIARPLVPSDIGITATHRRMNSAIMAAMPDTLQRAGLRVDTPERWQGLQRPVMLAVHPLSGVVQPSSFDLDTGRLCVMASRHRSGFVLLSRDHVGETLRRLIPAAEQAVGRPDVTGRGHHQHLTLWTALEVGGRVVAA